MQYSSTRKFYYGVFGLVAMLFIFLFCLGLFFISVTSSVAGSATLPHGGTAQIDGPFSCSVTKGTTSIEAGGYVFDFSPTQVTVDKVPVANMDPSITDVHIQASFWTASLHLNGNEVVLPR